MRWYEGKMTIGWHINQSSIPEEIAGGVEGLEEVRQKHWDETQVLLHNAFLSALKSAYVDDFTLTYHQDDGECPCGGTWPEPHKGLTCAP